MSVELLCNGKVNPLSVEYNNIFLQVKTNIKVNIISYSYKFYDSLENYKKNNCFYSRESKSNCERFDFSLKKENKRIFWDVVVKTKNEEIKSSLNFFSCALLPSKIVGQWIENPNLGKTVSEFSKDFIIEKEVISAYLYICGLGMYSSSINGVKTDELYYKPVLTDFEKREGLNSVDYNEKNFKNGVKKILYDTFDVSFLLKLGNNTLSILLGTGWYYDTDKIITDPAFYFGTPKLFFELHIQYADKVEIIKSDANVKVCNTDRISQLFLGDRGDFTKKDREYYYARVVNAPKSLFLPNLYSCDKIEKILTPLEVFGCDTEGRLFDFGINHSGSIHLIVKGKAGAKLIIRYYEIIEDNKPNPHTSRWIAYNMQTGKPVNYIDQCDEYVLDEVDREIEPLFHWNCYRYVEIIGKDIEIKKIESYFIHTDINQNGYFKCSNKLFNKIFDASVLTQKDNMHCCTISDCPHREKLPYTGDGALIIQPVLYNFDSEFFYRKWLDDLIESQGKDGWIPYSAPNMGGGGGYWWSNALPTVAEKLYSFTGDISILQKSFTPIEKYISFCKNNTNENNIITKSTARWLLGEWLAPTEMKCSISYYNTVAYLYAVLVAKKFAHILHFENKIALYSKLEQEIKNGLVKEFFHEDMLDFSFGVQGENVLALYFDFVPKEYKQKFHEKVINFYKKEGHFDTGIISTPFLLEYLYNTNEDDVAFNLMNSTGYPSFSNMLEGETTLKEFWGNTWIDFEASNVEMEGKGEISHCHPMFSSVITWFYKSVAGINLDRLGEKLVYITPRCFSHIESAKAEKDTQFGEIKVEYSKVGANKFNYKIEAPYCLTTIIDIKKNIINRIVINEQEVTKDNLLKFDGGTCLIEIGEE